MELSSSTEAVSQNGRIAGVLGNLIVWPGVGHLLAGRFVGGALWMLGSLATIVLAPVSGVVPLLGAVVLRLLSAVEVGARRLHRSPGIPSRLAAVALGLGALWVTGIVARTFLVQAFKIPSRSMVPTLLVGDHVFASKAIDSDEIARGDVVVYSHPCRPRFEMAHRVIALSGDTVEVRCDALYVNGAAVPQRLVEGPCTFWDHDEGAGWRPIECSRYVETLDGREHEIAHSSEHPARAARRAADPTGVTLVDAGRHDFPLEELPGCGALGLVRAGEVRGRMQILPTPATSCGQRRRYLVPAGHVFVMGDNRESSSDSRTWGAVPVELIKGRIASIWWSAGSPDEGVRWGRIGDDVR